MATNLTYEQAELQLKILDLRRESRLRQARDSLSKKYFGSTFRLLHEDLFLGLTSGEFFFVWERVKPTIREGRQRFSNPLILANLEKAANRYETCIEDQAPGHVVAMRQMMKQMAARTSKAA